MKKAWLAALLNVLPGLGYLYVGTRRTFSIMLLLFWPIIFVGGALEPAAYDATTSSVPTPISVDVAFLVLWAAFPVDAFLETKRKNKAKH